MPILGVLSALVVLTHQRWSTLVKMTDECLRAN